MATDSTPSPTSGSSATPWARSRCPPTRCGAPRPSAPWRTSRSPGAAWSAPRSARSAWSRRPPRASTGGSACSTPELADADRRRGRRGGRRRARRPLPHRRVPDRLGHQLQHERQRGHRDARHAALSSTGVEVHPNDHVNASQSSNDVFPTTIHLAATEASPPTSSPRWSTWPRRCAAGRRTGPTSSRPGRTHLMDAVPDHARPGGGRLGHAGRVRRGAGARRAPPARPAADRRHGRRHRAQRAGRVRRGGGRGAARGDRPRHAVRGPRPHRGPGRPRRARRGVRRRCGRSRCRCSRWPTTSAGWAPGRAPGSPSCACPTCSPAARSCRARSTR